MCVIEIRIRINTMFLRTDRNFVKFRHLGRVEYQGITPKNKTVDVIFLSTFDFLYLSGNLYLHT